MELMFIVVDSNPLGILREESAEALPKFILRCYWLSSQGKQRLRPPPSFEGMLAKIEENSYILHSYSSYGGHYCPYMVIREGIEPSLMGSKPSVLPLDDLIEWCNFSFNYSIITYVYGWQCSFFWYRKFKKSINNIFSKSYFINWKFIKFSYANSIAFYIIYFIRYIFSNKIIHIL